MVSLRPTSRAIGLLIAAVLMGVAGVLVGGKSLVTAAAMLVALVFSTLVWALIPQRRAAVRRDFTPALPHVGEAVAVQLTVTGVVPRVRAGRWVDRMPPSVLGAATGQLGRRGPRAGRGAPLIDEVRSVQAAARGRWPVGPLELTTGDPFGFFVKRSELGEATPLLIAPAIRRLVGIPTSTAPARTTDDRTTNAASAHGADSVTPRDYAPGDAMRRVHWRASAHRGQLMVRQEDRLESPEATVVLCARGEPGPGFERVVSACASVAVHLRASDWRVRVVDSAGDDLDRGGLMARLAELAPDKRAPLANAGVRGTTEILIAETISADEARALVSPRGGRGIVLVYALADEAADALAANGWRTGSIADSVGAGWGHAR